MTNEQTRADFEAEVLKNKAPFQLHRLFTGEYQNYSIEELWLYWQAATAKANQWRPIADAPKGRKLLLGYPNKLGKWRTITGCYYPPQTLLIADDTYNDDLDDDGYAPEGWYEESESHDSILRTDEPPTHWQPLPLPPTDT